MTNGKVIGYVVSAFAIALACLFAWIYNRRRREIIEAWAKSNAYAIRSVRQARLWEHPDFFRLLSGRREGWRVELIDSAGMLRIGVVTLKSDWLRPLRGSVRVVWDKIQAPDAIGFPVIALPSPAKGTAEELDPKNK